MLPALRGKFGIVSQDGSGINVGLFVAYDHQQILTKPSEVLHTSNRLAASIIGTKVI